MAPSDPAEPDHRAFIRLGPGIVTDLAAGLRREWLVTNGLGGYAFGTVAGIPTRRYHGPLVAALEPPVGRVVLVGALLERVTIEGREPIALHALELGGRPDGRRRLPPPHLVPFVAHLADAGLGTISECFEPEPPFEPRACIAQAWGVAEVLRQMRRLEAAPGQGAAGLASGKAPPA